MDITDITTEEFSHLKIVGATVTMLLNGINGEWKDAAAQSPITKLTHDPLVHERLRVLMTREIAHLQMLGACCGGRSAAVWRCTWARWWPSSCWRI